MSVIAYHVSKDVLASGLLGVDIFFVISGFVVSASVQNFEGSLTEFIGNFYARRFIRILPNLLAALTLISTFSILFVPILSFEATAFASHFGYANLSLDGARANYFSPQTEFNPYTHMWSLGVEEQFYLIFPFIYFYFFRKKTNLAFKLLGLFSICCISWQLGVKENDKLKAFYFPIYRAWELGAGVLLFHLVKLDWLQSAVRRLGNFPLFSVIPGLLLLALWRTLNRNFESASPNEISLAVVLITSLVVGFLAVNPRNFISVFLGLKVMRYVGKISFGLYLFHWPVFVILRWTIGMHTPPLVFLGLAVTATLSIASYHFIESYFKRNTASLRPSAVLFIGILAVTISSFITSKAYQNKSKFAMTLSSRNPIDWGSFELKIGNCQSTKNIEGPFKWQFERYGECPPIPKKPRLFVLGDSHADNYSALLKSLSMIEDRSITLFAQGGCTFLNLKKPVEDGTLDCQLFFKNSLKEIYQTAEVGDIIFLPGLRIERMSDWFEFYGNDPKLIMNKSAGDQSIAIHSAVDQLKALRSKGLFVVFELPKPIFISPTFRCVDWFNKSNPMCKYGLEMDRSELLKYRLPIVEAASTVKAQLDGGFYIFDPFPILCPDNTNHSCSAMMNSNPLFFDQDHLSSFGAQLLLETFRQLLTKIDMTSNKN